MSGQTPPSYGQATNPPQAIAGAPPQLPTAADQIFWTVGPDRQSQMFYESAGMPAQPTPQAVAYTPPVAPAVQPVTGALPLKFQPYSYLYLSLTVMIVCAVLNITSLAFGIPAFILSHQSEEKKRFGQYEKAKRFGAGSLILTVIDMAYTFLVVTLTIGLTLGLYYQDYCYY